MAGESKGRKVEIRVNGALLAFINTENAVAADYLNFLVAVNNAISHPESLEAEANRSGKTIRHAGFASFGSKLIDDEQISQPVGENEKSALITRRFDDSNVLKVFNVSDAQDESLLITFERAPR